MVFAAYVLKERPTWMQKGFTVLSVAGVMFIFVMKGVDVESASLKGSLLILLSALSSAMYNTAARKMTQRFKLTELTYIMSAIGFVVFNAIALVRHGAAGTVGTYFQPFREPGFVLSIVYLGVLSSLVTSFLSNYTLSRIEAFKMSAFNHVSTIVTMIAGVVILNESLVMVSLCRSSLYYDWRAGEQYQSAEKNKALWYACKKMRNYARLKGKTWL